MADKPNRGNLSKREYNELIRLERRLMYGNYDCDPSGKLAIKNEERVRELANKK